MLRSVFVLLLAFLGSLGHITARVLAQGGPPPPDATPGSVGFSSVTLGGIEPASAPGYRMEVREITWEPGAYATRHFHPSTIIFCVAEGALGFAIQRGAATLTRGGTADAPGMPEPLTLNTAVVLQPRDCMAFDQFAAHNEHTGWNVSDGPTVLWQADLLQTGEQYTTYVDAKGTPVP
jgi:hypothetical protein